MVVEGNMAYIITYHGLFARVLAHEGFVWIPNLLSASHFSFQDAQHQVRVAKRCGFDGTTAKAL
jgi:hypothetical protein